MKRVLLLNGSVVDCQQEISKISSTTTTKATTLTSQQKVTISGSKNMRIKRESPCLGLRFMPIKLGR